ncbi:lanthionine synthetase C family protein [Streptomyces sp. NPDC003077]|uniref:lanthionine synthetase C family protein n=1 Tax=Streptomyces sp. NPDC003077 TaxID=3154443 RepID=UPI0033A32E73
MADRLTEPPDTWPSDYQGWSQSLAVGAPGIALLHAERAVAGAGPWHTAHVWLRRATREHLATGASAGLFFGAPALALAAHTAAAGPGMCRRAAHALDRQLATLTHRRVDRACERIRHGALPTFAEYDVITGLTGLGALHLLRHPHGDPLQRVLSYLVRLTQPLPTGDGTVPGWWTEHAPIRERSHHFPGGHANLGLAHGITGPLALLSLALRQGITVDGHTEGITRICSWLDTWRQDHPSGPWWPQWITRAEHLSNRTHQPRPLRPSWCYGTPGIGRALQLAALATGDRSRQHTAEQAVLGCLTDPAQLAQITDPGLCHGAAGLLHTVRHIAAEAITPGLANHLPALSDKLLRLSAPKVLSAPKAPAVRWDRTRGLLEGEAGRALALCATATGAPLTAWDSCLLIASGTETAAQ